MRAITEPDDYGIVDPLKEAEDARLQAWEDFVAVLRNGRTSVLLRHAADLIEDRRDPFYRTPIKDDIDTFAQAHGWPATLRAIAQAMQDDERHRRELVDRR
jgi:hypothetical protein